MFGLSGALIVGFLFKILTTLGISTITYLSMDSFLSYVFNYFQSTILSGAFSHSTLCIMGIMGIDKFINILFSGLTARLAMTTMKKLKVF